MQENQQTLSRRNTRTRERSKKKNTKEEEVFGEKKVKREKIKRGVDELGNIIQLIHIHYCHLKSRWIISIN